MNTLLRYILKKHKVTVINNPIVTSSDVKNRHCVSVTTNQNGKKYSYKGTHFIIATGGIISNGILTKQNRVWEPIFNIDLPTTLLHYIGQIKNFILIQKSHTYLA